VHEVGEVAVFAPRARDERRHRGIGARAGHRDQATDDPGEQDARRRDGVGHEAGADEDAGADHHADVDADARP
jgi:hypothetical protein